jgi:flavodoxin I
MVAVIYGSSTLNTEYVSQRLVAAIGSDHADLHNVKDIEPSLIEDRSGLVFVTSTWGTGDLQDDWELFLPRMEELSFEGKVVGLVGVGDQDNYPETFCDSIAILYDLVTRNGGRVVGATDTEGYSFKKSKALREGRFVGLVLDEDNQADHTDERIREWVKVVFPSLAATTPA